LVAIVLRRTSGSFEEWDGMIQKKPTMTLVWEPDPNEIKVEKTNVGEAVQEAMP